MHDLFSGKASKHKSHPDYVPSLFSYSPISDSPRSNSVKKLDRYNRVSKRNPVVRKALSAMLSDNVDEADWTLDDCRNTEESVYLDSHVDCDILNVGSEEISCADNSEPVLNVSVDTQDNNYSLVTATSEDIGIHEDNTSTDVDVLSDPGSPKSLIAEPLFNIGLVEPDDEYGIDHLIQDEDGTGLCSFSFESQGLTLFHHNMHTFYLL